MVIVYIRLSSLDQLASSPSIRYHLSTLFRARYAGFPHSTRCRIFMTRAAGMRLGGYQGTLTWNWLNKPLPSADIRNIVHHLWAGMLCRTRFASGALCKLFGSLHPSRNQSRRLIKSWCDGIEFWVNSTESTSSTLMRHWIFCSR